MSSGRKLKKYEEYKRRLLAYAQANGITVTYNGDPNSEGEWLPSVRRVKIYADMPNSSEIATLLHELGHSVDDTFSDEKKCERLNRAYVAYYAECERASQRRLVVESEIRAWELGRKVAKALKIRLGTWYDIEQVESVQEYKES